MIAMRTKRKQHLQRMGIFLFLLAFSISGFLLASSSGAERSFAVFEKVNELKETLNTSFNSSFELVSNEDDEEKGNFSEGLELSSFFRAAGEVNLLFGQGYIGTQGTNTNQADGILNLSTLGISRIGFSQDDADGDGLFGGTQGNDLAGTLKFYFSNGTTLVRTGAINWRETTGSKVEVMGFILDDGQADYPITYGSSQTFILKSGTTPNVSSTIGLKSIFSNFTFTDLEDRSGNAATSGLLDALNAELGNAAQVSSIGLTSSSVVEGNNLVYTVTLSKATPAVQFFDFSTSGTGTSSTDFNSTYSFSNGVVNNGDGTITVPAGVSSFTVTVTTIDDTEIESTETVILTVGSKSGTGNILDNDFTPGITITPNNASGAVDGNGNLITTEAGASNTFSVVLDAQPTANVTVTITGLDATEGTLSTTTLTFTPANWNTPQTVTVTGVDDPQIDGDIVYTLTATANGGGYTNQTDTVGVVNEDDDTPGITITPNNASGAVDGNGNLITTEAGASNTFSVVLDAQPTANVTVTITGLDATEGTLSTTTLTFTPANWNTPQTVTVTGADDPQIDGDIVYTLTATANGGGYTNQTDTIGVINLDNDNVGITVVGKSDVSEGSNAVFTVSLSATTGTAIEIALALGNGSDSAESDDYSATYTAYYFVGATKNNLTITSGKVSLPAGVGSFFVSVPTTSDNVFEGAENFTLAATITGGSSDSDTATIKDDGSGKVYDEKGIVDPAATPDDDRALSVSSPTVNEGSPTVVFTVSGAPNQLVSLALANVTTGGLSGLQYSTDGGQTWNTYTSGNVALNGSGKMLVRTSLTPEQESASDNGETLTLTATNTSGTPAVGTGTVKDDGTGTIFNEDGTENTTAPKDDDRALTVNSVVVNEIDPFAEFTVTGAAGQLVSLSLADGTATVADYGSGLEYFNGTSWVPYTPGALVALDEEGKLKVRTPIKQDEILEGKETFTLIATNTGGTPATGTATIVDYVTIAKDDFATVRGTSGGTISVSGNVLDNDLNTGGEDIELTAKLVTDPKDIPGTLVFKEDGSYTFTPAPGFSGPIEIVYSVCGGDPFESCDTATLFIDVQDLITPQPDINATYLGIPLKGTAATNDDVPAGSTYGTPVADEKNPSGAKITMNPDGSYTFEATTPGVYNFTIAVCAPDGSCVTTTLSITVKERGEPSEPILKTDLGTVKQGGPIVINTLGNDAPGRVGVTLNPGSVKIMGQPKNGTVTVDPTTGKITYTPNPGFVGKDVYTYTVCDTGNPALCATAIQEITVVSKDAANLIYAADDFVTGPSGSTLSGVVIQNDADLEGNKLVVTPQQTETEQGTFTLNANGSFTFVPKPGFIGPVQLAYRVCTDGEEPICTTATLYLLVAPNDILAVMDNFQANEINGLLGGVAGNVLTNDLINSKPVKPTDVKITVVNNGGMTGVTIDANGNLNVPKGAAPGRYVVTYSICDANDPTNCSEAMVIVEVFHGVNLRVFKSAVTPSKFEGDQMEFVIRVENNGNTDASAVVVTDRLDAGFSYLSSTVTGATAATSVAGQEVKWTFASLPAGRSAEITVVVKARPLTDGREKSIGNTATVTSPARELSPNDNSSTTSVTVKPFFLSNVITPNGDGKNDAFVINGLGKFASNELIIFNRYGDHVFQKKGYQNDWAGEGLVAGTYFYILSVVDINGNPTEFKGWIQLILE